MSYSLRRTDDPVKEKTFMEIFLLNSDTFKKSFLSGDGRLVLQSDADIWMTLIATGGRFLPNIDQVADLKFDFNHDHQFRFGLAEGMKLSAGAQAIHQVHLIWPDQEDFVLKAHGLGEFLTEDKLYLRLLINARGDFGAEGKIPIGSLSSTFGIGAGGNVAYERLKAYDSESTAKQILDDLFAGVRLPQQITSVDDLPAPGEVLITRFGGYLNLRSGMNWGYRLTGSQSFEFNQLNLDLDYALRVMASISVGYRIAGDFGIEVRRGSNDGWVRFVVRKNRDSQFNLITDFDLDLTEDLKGLPESADEFLIRLIGADAQTVLGYFAQARKYSSLDELEKKLTPLLKGFVHDWSQNLIGKALTDSTLGEFLAAARKAGLIYNDLDNRIPDLYQAYLDKLPQLKKVLRLLATVANPAELIATLADAGEETSLDAWEIIMIVWGTNVYPLLLQNDEFNRFSALIKRIQSFIEDEATKPVRDFIARLKEAFPLDSLFWQLSRIKTPQELKQITDQKLLDLAGRLIGKAFNEIRQSELNDAIKTLQAGLDRIGLFRQTWHDKLKGAVRQNFTFDLHYALMRAALNERLLDIELDLNTPEGRSLVQPVAAGDFEEALLKYNSRYVRVNTGVFTHRLTESAHLLINVKGWGYDSLKQLTQRVEHAIESTSGGLLHVYATDTSIKQRIEKGLKFKEMIESNFLFRSIGETFQPDGLPQASIDPKTKDYLIETLKGIAVQYDLLEADDQTTPDELTRYLDFAQFLGLLNSRSRAAFVNDLARQFQTGLGRVKVTYVVRYNDRALLAAFKGTSGKDLRKLARQTMRQIISAKYTGMKRANWLARIGFAYLTPSLHEIFDHEGFTGLGKIKSVTLPGWFTGGAPVQVGLSNTDIQLLTTLCHIENRYADRLVRLDKILDQAWSLNRPIPQDELKDAAHKFVEMADDLDNWRENAFFAIFDKLVLEAAGGRATRKSAMVVEIQPPGKNKVTKVLMK